MASMASQEGGKGGKGGDANGESGEERKAEKVDSKAKPFRSYYGDWNAKAAELAREVDEEEDAAAEEARNAGGPMSKEEAEDRRKHEALKKAKKLWEGRKAAEKSLVYELTKAKASSLKNDIVVTEDLTGGLPVFEVKGCEDCRIFFPPMLRGSKSPMIKIVISDCKDCSLIVACPLMVGIDIVHCEGCKLEMPAVAEEAIVKTLQVDLSKDVSLTYTKGGSKSEVDFTRSKFKVYHAGVIGLRVSVQDIDSLAEPLDYTVLMQEKEHDEEGTPAAEVQFVTQLSKAGKLCTDKVIRVGQQPTTQRELDEEEGAKPASARVTASSKLQLAEQDKIGGNEAFKAREYAQAGVFYTKAIRKLLELPDKPPPDLLHICYSNRAACELKLGRHETALNDAKACLELKPDFAKGLFRAGLALHALKRYDEAGPYFAKALEIDPKSKQVQQAMQFCQLKMRQERAKIEQRRR